MSCAATPRITDALAVRAQAGDEAALEDLLNGCRAYAHTLWVNWGREEFLLAPLEDWQQDATAHALHALRRWDPNHRPRPLKFRNYWVWQLRGQRSHAARRLATEPNVVLLHTFLGRSGKAFYGTDRAADPLDLCTPKPPPATVPTECLVPGCERPRLTGANTCAGLCAACDRQRHRLTRKYGFWVCPDHKRVLSSRRTGRPWCSECGHDVEKYRV